MTKAPSLGMCLSNESDVEDALMDLLNLFPIIPTSSEPAKLTPYLVLGSFDDAKDLDLLKKYGVTSVINCAEGEVGSFHYEALSTIGIRCQGFSSLDSQEYNMSKHFPCVLEEVTTAKTTGGCVLIHCVAGVNRSGFLCIALLCALEKLPLLEAAARAKEARGRVCTNRGFQRQLMQLAKQNHWKLV